MSSRYAFYTTYLSPNEIVNVLLGHTCMQKDCVTQVFGLAGQAVELIMKQEEAPAKGKLPSIDPPVSI